MSLTDRINAGIKDAMKQKDEARKRTLRAVKAQLLLLKTSGSGTEITEDQEIKLLQKMVKERQDSYEIYVKQNRDDLAAPEKEEMDIIKEFLPQQMGEDELREAIKGIIDQVGATSMKDMGKVMGMANKQFAGKADGKTISTIVKSLLS
ncbi:MULTISPECIES: GatB/YqeY domain-containing protein [unclassified Aureispira]|uniref:GatB/YqeY domain-containing protein n=1 Tax=unclassified Aureispira TaxID=2649989 RepID=UPI00069733A7|nr:MULTISPECIES: GatB/YqeY domain-containing protein [unclassified Aureispira]WMX14789.1 GatB/YqeY domain-containing protein [Aureispira sp. CCB-E]